MFSTFFVFGATESIRKWKMNRKQAQYSKKKKIFCFLRGENIFLKCCRLNNPQQVNFTLQKTLLTVTSLSLSSQPNH